MLYANVVLGLAVQGPFDYFVPENLREKINIGTRVRISFRTREVFGYVVKLTKQTKIKNLKPILEIIDDSPILDRIMLLLTKELSDYYGCSWGEAIETALPEGLRKGKLSPMISRVKKSLKPHKSYWQERERDSSVILIHDLNGKKRWDIYINQIKDTLDKNKSVIVILPDKDCILRAKEIINAKFNLPMVILYRKQPKELDEWAKVKGGNADIVIGTRSAIFAPLDNLGLVIIDEEQDLNYKQDQMPHYHPREVAFMRIKRQKAKLILGSRNPSLESFYLAKKRKIKYIDFIDTKDFPDVDVIDTKNLIISKRKNIIFSKYLEDSIHSNLNSNGKILLFLNRKGFATSAACRHCSTVLKCPRCNINLVYHFKDNILNCHYCNFKMHTPQICPHCNSGYIRYSGMGTEKIESELSRLFPQARIKRLDNQKTIKIEDADIFIATKSIIKERYLLFDIIAVLYIDNYLNRIDFRSAENTFALLIGLLGLAKRKLIIQTSLPKHYCFQSLLNKDIDIFFEKELKLRRQLSFPPFKHLGSVKLRGKKESRVIEVSNTLYKRLKKYNKNKTIDIISVNPAQPAKLRDNFYWQILIKGSYPKQITKFIKKHLKDFPHSGIIVTVDIDPL